MGFLNASKRLITVAVTGLLCTALPARALPPETLESVVSVLPLWPGKPQGGAGTEPGVAPEGSGIVMRADGIIVTAWHVVETADRIDVRLSDGRILPARLLGHDARTDIALLKIGAPVPAIAIANSPDLASKACVIGNAYGLGLSVTCGVVSALQVTNAGFNPIEDFIQTDAAANPGSSGGALVDDEGRLVGMMSAIFASSADTNIGINFAVSVQMLSRVAAAVLSDGEVDFGDPGWRLAHLERSELARTVGVRIVSVTDSGAAREAGLVAGDLLQEVGGRSVRSPRDAVTAIALQYPGRSFSVRVQRGKDKLVLPMRLEIKAPSQSTGKPAVTSARQDCPYDDDVCITRQAVFPIESFDPLASAVRIGPDLLVTNRHVVADRKSATVFTPNGPLNAEVVPSAYGGDLALLKVEGLPDKGLVLSPRATASEDATSYHAVGADLARRQVRVFAPGTLLSEPAEGAPLGRLHVSAHMQPGVSGGALINGTGHLIGIAAGGGEGRFEAIPVAQVVRLLEQRNNPDASKIHGQLGSALSACVAGAEGLERLSGEAETPAKALAQACKTSQNAGQMVASGRVLATVGAVDEALALHEAAVEQVPNSINNRLTLLVSLQLARRFEEMVPHARILLDRASDDPQILRLAIQAGVWGGDSDLADHALAALEKVNPAQATAARRFVDQPPEAPGRR